MVDLFQLQLDWRRIGFCDGFAKFFTEGESLLNGATRQPDKNGIGIAVYDLATIPFPGLVSAPLIGEIDGIS
jgi:hypothetical protein